MAACVEESLTLHRIFGRLKMHIGYESGCYPFFKEKPDENGGWFLKQIMKRFAMLFAVIIIFGLFFGCSVIDEPRKEAAEAHLEQDMDDLLCMVQWLQDTEYSYISFQRSRSYALADLAHIPMDEEIRPTVDCLLNKKGYRMIAMDREGNAIQFEFWSSVHEQDCGLVYVLNESRLPDIPYMTQCEPLSVDRWYYYFVDVNKWRVERQQ